MVVKEKEIEFGLEKIKVRQVSFAGQLRLDSLGDKRTILDIYKECLDKPEILEKITTEEGLELSKAINEVNGWGEKKQEDFQKSHS